MIDETQRPYRGTPVINLHREMKVRIDKALGQIFEPWRKRENIRELESAAQSCSGALFKLHLPLVHQKPLTYYVYMKIS